MGRNSVTVTVISGLSTASRTIDIPDAGNALARQRELMNAGDLGPYDRITNSCVSHVCDVLSSGGVSTPDALGSQQLRHVFDLLKGSGR